jgi:hypothetical protein
VLRSTIVKPGRLLACITLSVLLSVVPACGSGVAPPPSTPTSLAPGALLLEPTSLATLPALQQLAQRAVKIRYRSTSGLDGSATTVSGVLFVPKGIPPAGGWPIASIGHPTVGLGTECAPSAYPGLMGNAGTIAQFLTFGYVVVMSDFQGLGTPGPHPYLEPTTAANNVIDAVRAAREAVPEASDSWIGYGVSQGGQAVWAANEEAEKYGKGLRLVGTISIAPVTDLRPLVDAMQNGTLTIAQKVILPMVLKGLQLRHPALNLDDYLHGVVVRSINVFLGCEGDDSSVRGIIAEGAPASDFTPTTPRAADQLREWFGAEALPRGGSSAAMMVGYGDADKVVLPQWTAEAIQRGCSAGEVIDAQVAPGQGHGILDLGSAPQDWTRGRFEGTAPPNSCAIG